MGTNERLAKGRIWLLLAAGLSFAVWHLAEMRWIQATTGDTLTALVPFMIVVWGAAMLGLFAWSRKAGAKASLNDELTQHNRLVALGTGFWSMLFIAALGLTLANRDLIAPTDFARLIMIAGVTAPLFAFVLLEWPDASRE